jgi:membrane protease YdiL (CAAX protease family)
VNDRATADGDHLRRLIWWSSLVGALILHEYAARLGGGTPDRNVLYQWGTAITAAVVYLILLLLVLAIAGGRRDLLALRRPRSWPVAVGLGLALLVGVYIAIAIADPLLHGGREQGLTPTHWEPAHAGAFAANFVVIAGVAPFVEEVTFRGLGFSLFLPYGVVTAILTIGATFALAHGLVQAFPELALFGCALAWLRWKTTSVYPGMLLHGTFNAIALLAAVSVHHS